MDGCVHASMRACVRVCEHVCVCVCAWRPAKMSCPILAFLYHMLWISRSCKLLFQEKKGRKNVHIAILVKTLLYMDIKVM